MNPNANRIRFAAAALAAALLVPCAFAQSTYGFGPGRGNGPAQGQGVAPVAAEPATAAEAKWLAFMREEEKLARDVYRKLAEKWNLAVFRNIAESEDTHFKTIGTLLERYKVADPAANTPDGVYADNNLTALYAELIAKGVQSVEDALAVGVLIEKADIADLEEVLGETSKLDIKRVYTNLLNGSFNHLEAFEAAHDAVCIVQ